MTRFRLTLALSMAVILIGIATWKRFDQPSVYVANLVPVQNAGNSITEEEADNAALAEGYAEMGISPDATSSNATSTADLSSTDLVGRQFMSDYLDLAANGEATDDNIAALAGNYANSITSLSSTATVGPEMLTVIADSAQNFTAYSSTISNLYQKYQSATADIVKRSGDMSDISSQGFVPGMNALASLYQSAAKDLEDTPVPTSLADAHLRLVNNYLSSSASFKALANATSDSASAYSALVTEAQNSSDESAILQSIQAILAINDVSFYVSSGT
jgi:hypothetical protein